jgi:peptidoglycan/LPS O-acetylase OafA/YrhL
MFSFNGCIIAYCCYFGFSHLIHFKGAHIFKSLLLAIFTGCMLAVLFQYGTRQRKKLNSLLLGLGEKSYSLYVVHLPILSLLLSFFKTMKIANPYIIYFSGILGVSFVTLIFYKFIEHPMHNFAVRSSNRVIKRFC